MLPQRGCGCFVCEPVQEPSGQVLAQIWALKASFKYPITGQVQVQGANTRNLHTCEASGLRKWWTLCGLLEFRSFQTSKTTKATGLKMHHEAAVEENGNLLFTTTR